MNITRILNKTVEWYHLGGAALVSRGIYTKFESSYLDLDHGVSEVNLTLNGTSYKVSKGEPVYRWKRFERGVIMPEVKRPMDEILDPGDTFIDVGAAMGDTALYGHSLVSEEGEVHAFEPDIYQYKNLTENIKNNNNLENVNIYNQAVGEYSGKIEPEKIIGRGTKEFRDNIDEIGPISVTTLDKFIEEQRIEPDLVKIDVDGVEDQVLQGAKRTVIGTCPIIVELHNSDILENRSETIELIFDLASEVEFLGVQGTAASVNRYGQTLTGSNDLENDVVTNLLIR